MPPDARPPSPPYGLTLPRCWGKPLPDNFPPTVLQASPCTPQKNAWRADPRLWVSATRGHKSVLTRPFVVL